MNPKVQPEKTSETFDKSLSMFSLEYEEGSSSRDVSKIYKEVCEYARRHGCRNRKLSSDHNIIPNPYKAKITFELPEKNDEIEFHHHRKDVPHNGGIKDHYVEIYAKSEEVYRDLRDIVE